MTPIRPSLVPFLLCVNLGCGVDEDDEPTLDPVEARSVVEALGLGADHRCGAEMTKYRPTPTAVRTPVFKGKDRPWHDWRPCLEDLTGLVKPDSPALVLDTIYNQVLYLLSHERVKFYRGGKDGRDRLDEVVHKEGRLAHDEFDRLVETNDHGLAYTAMDQVDLGISLLRLHKAMLGGHAEDPRTDAYLSLGLAALDVLVDEVSAGGLRSKKTCAKRPQLTCAWFHAQTNTGGEQTEVGGTLNKHLYGVRDLYQAGNVLQDIAGVSPSAELDSTADRYQRVALQGMNQMVYASAAKDKGDLPNLLDYIPRHKGEPIANSWLYYGRNIVEGKPYFLNENDYKNCSYHMLVIKLLQRNLEHMLTEGADITGFTEKRGELGASVVDFVVNTFVLKQADGLYVDSKTKPGGNFKACSELKVEDGELDAAIAALQAL